MYGFLRAVASFLERGAPGRKISRYNGFLHAPRASQNVTFYRSSGRKNIENSGKIGVY